MIESSSVLLVILALVATALTLIVAYRYRDHYVPVGWYAFLAMAAGSITFAAFYAEVIYVDYHGYDRSFLVPSLRFLIGFILVSTILLAIGALVVKKPVDE